MLSARGAIDLLQACAGKRVGVVGDFCLDEYIHTTPIGISPESPILRLRDDHRSHTAGAAGNVALNLAALGCAVHAFGVVGADRERDVLVESLRKCGVTTSGLVADAERVTPLFSRVLVNGPDGIHPHLRLDRENRRETAARSRDETAERVRSALGDLDALVFADYDESHGCAGTLTAKTIADLVSEAGARGVRTAGLSRQRLSALAGVDHVFCNEAEARALGFRPEEDLATWAAGVRDRLRMGTLSITFGEAGVFATSASGSVREAAPAVTVVDTCGAGDTLACVTTLALLCGASLADASVLGVRAASIVVQQSGTVPITRGALARSALRTHGPNAKLLEASDLDTVLAELRRTRTIVFTNGHFDLFHAGHVALLRAARQRGDVLVVGINSDRSTRANKGEGRPVLVERERIQILSALECVDYITVFDELTPVRLIRLVRPDVLVKGGDYAPDEVVGKDVVEAAGGVVDIIPYDQARNTTRLIESVKVASLGVRVP